MSNGVIGNHNMADNGQILLLDKPLGLTSYDVIRKLKPCYPGQKIGHAGTLDPLASGLLVVAIGRATKQLHSLLKLPKAYKAEILIGYQTSTADREGEIIRQVPVKELSQETVEATCATLVGAHELPVPLYSAIKVAGRPLYWYARKGVTPPQIPHKTMEVTAIACQSVRVHPTMESVWLIEVDIAVASGTYIRVLAEELGRRLGYPASLWSLRRTSIGDMRVTEARPLSWYTDVND